MVVLAFVGGCVSADTRGPLMIYTGRVNGAADIEIIRDALPMFIENAFDVGNNNRVYMHNNALAYASKYFEMIQR